MMKGGRELVTDGNPRVSSDQSMAKLGIESNLETRYWWQKSPKEVDEAHPRFNPYVPLMDRGDADSVPLSEIEETSVSSNPTLHEEFMTEYVNKVRKDSALASSLRFLDESHEEKDLDVPEDSSVTSAMTLHREFIEEVRKDEERPPLEFIVIQVTEKHEHFVAERVDI